MLMQQDTGQKVYAIIQRVLAGEWRVADECPDGLGVWKGIVQSILEAYKQGYRKEGTQEAAIAMAERMIVLLSGQYPELPQLLGYTVVAEVPVEVPSMLFPMPPTLPVLTGKKRGPDLTGLGADACQWLDAYIAFSKQWSTRGYELFHEGVGLWVLSAIAMRRVYVPLLSGIYPSLYIALASKSSGFRKSTTANVGHATLRAAGLGDVFMTDHMTPQVFVRRGSRFVPENYSQLAPDKQKKVETRLLYGGKQSYALDEFLVYLNALASGSGHYAGFRDIFLRYYDCPSDLGSETIGRGLDFVERPYMAMLVNFTPAHIQNLPNRGAMSLWQDGTWPRWVFITPPAGLKPPDDPMPEWMEVPDHITEPLRRWHDRLGKPQLAMAKLLDAHGKETGRYEAQVDWGDPSPVRLSSDVKAAYDAYDLQINKLLQEDGVVPEELHMWYVRSAQRTLRIATLFASLENGNVMELRHYARAQQIVERWRGCVHEFHRQINDYGVVTEERRLDNKIIEKMHKAYEDGELPVSLAYLQQRIGASADQLKHSVDALVRAEMIVPVEKFGGKNRRRPMVRYSLPGVVLEEEENE